MSVDIELQRLRNGPVADRDELEASWLADVVDGLMRALESALHLSAAEQKRRIHAMRRQVKRHDVYRWADAFFAALHGDAS